MRLSAPQENLLWGGEWCICQGVVRRLQFYYCAPERTPGKSSFGGGEWINVGESGGGHAAGRRVPCLSAGRWRGRDGPGRGAGRRRRWGRGSPQPNPSDSPIPPPLALSPPKTPKVTLADDDDPSNPPPSVEKMCHMMVLGV